MTTRRRAARHPKATVAQVAGFEVPPELLDGESAVWHDQRLFREFMAERGWSLPCAERFGVATHPGNRRTSAATGWAAKVGITSGGHADLHRLRALGVLPEPGR